MRLRFKYPRVPRIVDAVKPLHHGQSISLTGSECRGSACVFLSADNEDGIYALTAGNISDTPIETRVVTRGYLDILAPLAQMRFKYSDQEYGPVSPGEGGTGMRNAREPSHWCQPGWMEARLGFDAPLWGVEDH